MRLCGKKRTRQTKTIQPCNSSERLRGSTFRDFAAEEGLPFVNFVAPSILKPRPRCIGNANRWAQSAMCSGPFGCTLSEMAHFSAFYGVLSGRLRGSKICVAVAFERATWCDKEFPVLAKSRIGAAPASFFDGWMLIRMCEQTLQTFCRTKIITRCFHFTLPVIVRSNSSL